MPLLGTGLLAIWNDIAPEAESEFLVWHVREHIPERVGIPGFLRGRRYVARTGVPRYFNFYETETPDTLRSSAYKARLDAPSEWTRRVVTHFRNTSRTLCHVVRSAGIGGGAHAATLRLSPITTDAGFVPNIEPVLAATLAAPGIVGMHLMRGDTTAIVAPTAEMALRGGVDATVAWLLLVEATTAELLDAALATTLRPEDLDRAGAPRQRVERGSYMFQYGLSAEELRLVESSR